jgi:hypothetical protein
MAAGILVRFATIATAATATRMKTRIKWVCMASPRGNLGRQSSKGRPSRRPPCHERQVPLAVSVGGRGTPYPARGIEPAPRAPPAGFDRPHSDVRAMKAQGKGLFGNREDAAGFARCGGRLLALPRPRRAKARGVLSHCPTVAPRQQGGAQHLPPATNHQNIASPREGLLRWHDGCLSSIPAAGCPGAGVLQPRSSGRGRAALIMRCGSMGASPKKRATEPVWRKLG